MFKDRKEAGEKLAAALAKYKASKPVVLGIPRGGIEVGCVVARILDAPFSALVVRKLPFPDNPEAGFGSVAEDASVIILDKASSLLPPATIEQIKKEQLLEVKKRIALLRENRPLPEISQKTVILVDDGLAMGSTMLGAIAYCRNKKAAKIIVAVPISGNEAAALVKKAADKLIVLEKPADFYAVAQGYRNWYDVPYEEARLILASCGKK